MVYKIVHGLVDVAFDEFFEYADYGATRGHQFKLKIKRSNLLIRRNFFCVRIVPTWNALDSEIVLSPNLSIFKKRVKSLRF